MDALEEMLCRMQKTHTPQSLNKCSPDNPDFCPVCNNTGWEFVPDGSQGTCRVCKCGLRERQILRGRISFADIPESFKNLRLSDFSTDIYAKPESRGKAATAVNAVKYWFSEFADMKKNGMGLYFYSSTKGSGKTRMAAGVANELVHKTGIRVKFATSLQILDEIKASWDKQAGQSESSLLSFLTSAPVLVVDDFGTEQQEKPWINEKFYQIINTRYIDKKPTVFTSNIPLSALKFDERITNRIKERTFQIPFPEESVRDIIARDNMGKLVQGIKAVKE